ncbi:MAG: hypothetical protein WDN04_23110 [Rhodospirillales bacterium]
MLPRRQVGGDLLGLPVRIDDNMLHAGPGQPVQRVVQQGTMAELQQRLRVWSVSGRIRSPSPAASSTA